MDFVRSQKKKRLCQTAAEGKSVNETVNNELIKEYKKIELKKYSNDDVQYLIFKQK